jgi:hypothetical protein
MILLIPYTLYLIVLAILPFDAPPARSSSPPVHNDHREQKADTHKHDEAQEGSEEASEEAQEDHAGGPVRRRQHEEQELSEPGKKLADRRKC